MSKTEQNSTFVQRDPLTGLAGMDALRLRLQEWMTHDKSKQAESGTRLHVLMLSLRRFDALNLTYGAAVGDIALALVARRISQFSVHELEGPWLASRAGGGNFVLVANETCSRQRWQLFAGQLADIIALPIETTAGTLRLSPRIAMLRGVGSESAESVLDRLSQTLANMQRHQARRIAWADGETTRAGRTAVQLDSDLLRAIDGDEIEVVYQPQFAVDDDRLTGAEALARWNHKKLGRIGASAMLTIAERTDHIAQLSRHIAMRALYGAAKWPEHLRLSLNVTAIELSAENYAADLLMIMEQTGFPPDRLTLEVTEQALVSDLQLATRTLSTLTAAGVRIALDDFGAGFCNFRYLKTFPLHYLKLDRSMVDGIVSDPRDLAIFRAIVAMASALDLAVIAEGIETQEQRELIVTEGCAFYQGFLKAQPMNAQSFLAKARG